MMKGRVEPARMRRRDDGEEDLGEANKRTRRVFSDLRLAFEDLRLSLITPLAAGHDSNISSSSSSCCADVAIPTAAFLSASCLLLHVLDKIGPTMMVLRQDVKRNIERIEDDFVLNPSLYSNLVEILRREMEEGTAKTPQSCSRAIVWLTRSIDFSMTLMERLMKDPEMTLQKAVEEAYDATFRLWHGWISAAAYRVALRLIPDRGSFFDLLLDKKQDKIAFEKDIQNLFSLLHPVLDETYSHLREMMLDKLKSN